MRVQQLWSKADERSMTAFRAAMAGDDLANCLLAIEGLTTARRRRCSGHLDAWAQRVNEVQAGNDVNSQANALRQVLAKELGFAGEEDQQDRPCSVRMSRVMKRRRGTPIMLSAIWMEVGRRSGISVEGLAFPGHFIARVGGVEGPLVDPSTGGCCLSRQQCVALVAERTGNLLPWHDEYLEAVSHEQLVERALSRLSCCLRGACNPASLYRIVRFQAALRPEDLSLPMVLAALAEEMGAFRHAVALLEQVVADHSGTPEARAAIRWLPRLLSRCGTLH